MRDALICVYNGKSSEVGLIICLVNRIIVIGSLLGLMTCVAIGSDLSNGVRYGSHLMEQDLNLI